MTALDKSQSRLVEMVEASLARATKHHMDKVKSYFPGGDLDDLIKVVVETAFKQGFESGVNSSMEIICGEFKALLERVIK